MTLHLLPHPQSPHSPVSAIGVNVARLQDGQLSLQFTAVGRREDVFLPPLADARRADELWRHTCFEVFVAPLRREPYYEFNFSPSCEWAVYRFDSYRSGMSKPDLEPPSIEPMGVGPMFGLITVMNLAPLPELMPWESWRVGLSAVIEAEEGGISYWALMHPPGKPDFHNPDCFAVELAPAANL